MDGNPFSPCSVFLVVHLGIPVVFPLFHFALGGPVGCFQWTSLTICLKSRKPVLVQQGNILRQLVMEWIKGSSNLNRLHIKFIQVISAPVMVTAATKEPRFPFCMKAKVYDFLAAYHHYIIYCPTLPNVLPNTAQCIFPTLPNAFFHCPMLLRAQII